MSDIVPQLIAFYLPQFHPIPENDIWWGKGFTEWQNVVQARPLFPGHHQPRIPADLGFYDLRLPEVREGQADLARQYGIFGFCYYHYWFNGKRLLERPFNDVLSSGEPDFPFCLCWANESWTRTWDGRSTDYLIKQQYSEDDDRRHIRWLAEAFKDPRYIRYKDKPLILVYRAASLPDPNKTAQIWREETLRLGLGDLYLCMVESFPSDKGHPHDFGFDAAVEFQPKWNDLYVIGPARRSRMWQFITRLRLSAKAYQDRRIYDYLDLVERSLQMAEPDYPLFRCVTPSWDNSARRQDQEAVILKNASPDRYEYWLKEIIRGRKNVPFGKDLIFINAWNEWGEGCHLEPDLRNGRAYLEATRRALDSCDRE